MQNPEETAANWTRLSYASEGEVNPSEFLVYDFETSPLRYLEASRMEISKLPFAFRLCV